MASYVIRQLAIVATLAFLAVAAPRAESRFFFSNTARPAAVEPSEAAAAAVAMPEATPSTARPAGNNRGYGLYGRPEEHYSPTYFRGGVHRNVDKLTTTGAPTTERGSEPFVADNGSGRGRPYRRSGQSGMSDTRFYQNGRYYYDVNTGNYGYGYESNPVRTGPEEFVPRYGGAAGAGAGSRPGRYNGNTGYEYGNGYEFSNGIENQNNFQESQNQEYIP